MKDKGGETVCVILAGGQSRRMGRDKATLELAGKTFLSRLIETYSPVFPVFVSLERRGRVSHPGAGELVDRRPGMGPMAGLEAAFLDTDADAVFLTATDLPLGSPELARELLRRIGDADACVIRRRTGCPEPAFAVYRRTCLPTLQALLNENRRAMTALLERVRVQYCEEDALTGYDLPRLLLNVNRPEDYRQCLKLL